MTDQSEDDQTPAEPGRRGRSKAPFIIGGVIVVIIVVAVGALIFGGGGDSNKQSIRGTYVLFGNDLGSWSTCQGGGNNGGFDAGKKVTVTNDAGTVIGTGSTRRVESSKDREQLYDRVSADREAFVDPSDAQSSLEELEKAGRVCPLLFDVPIAMSDVYKIQIADGSSQTYSQDQLVKKKFVTNINLRG